MTSTTEKTILVPSESLPRTTSSGSQHTDEVPAGAFSGGLQIVKIAYFDASEREKRHPIPSAFTDIDDYVAGLETDPAEKQAMARARAVVAERLSAKLPPSIAKYRMQRGWSQRQLAEAMGTSQPHIARIENGKEDVRLSTIRRLAAALSICVSDVVSALEAVQNEQP